MATSSRCSRRDRWGFAWSPDSTRLAVWGTCGREIDVYGVDGDRQASLPLPRRMAPHYDAGPVSGCPTARRSSCTACRRAARRDRPARLSAGPWAGDLLAGRDSRRRGHGSLTSPSSTPRVRSCRRWMRVWTAWQPGRRTERIFASLSHGELNVVEAASGNVTVLTEATAALNGGDEILAPGFSPQGDRILTRPATVPGARGPLEHRRRRLRRPPSRRYWDVPEGDWFSPIQAALRRSDDGSREGADRQAVAASPSSPSRRRAGSAAPHGEPAEPFSSGPPFIVHSFTCSCFILRTA